MNVPRKLLFQEQSTLKIILFIVLLQLTAWVLTACSQELPTSPAPRQPSVLLNPNGQTIMERFTVPAGFERLEVEKGCFADYLRHLPLKPHNAPVLYYNGETKNKAVHAAVIDMDIGTRDLQQCADAIIRLRAEYLYSQKRYEAIHFNFTNGFKAEYSQWRQGYTIKVSGNKAEWQKKTATATDDQSFRRYLETVFAYAGTLSLSKELNNASVSSIQIGDVFIQGGSPGHCVMVVDMAENQESGERLFMLVQSYMPAQDIHILKNLGNQSFSPWYSTEFGPVLSTPEWSFNSEQLKRFEAQ